jgi:hypothetical protein
LPRDLRSNNTIVERFWSRIRSGRIYSRGTQPAMLAKLFNGQPIPEVISWAEEELSGFVR